MFVVPTTILESQKESENENRFDFSHDDDKYENEKKIVIIAGDQYDDWLEGIFGV